jgi:metal-sulfur cluster biosynthetic enzyme
LVDVVKTPLIRLPKIDGNCLVKLRATFEACRRAGIVAVSARQLKPIKITDVEVNNKSQIEFGQARY